MSVLTSVETARVEATIREVERHTSAEIVVATVERSEPYVDVRLWTVLGVSLTAASVTHWARPDLTASQILFVQLGAAAVTWFASAAAPVLRWLLPKHRAREAVERATALAFLKHGVFATRERTGVLILLSELEHQVSMLGDEGIHAQLQTAGWQELVKHVVQRLREGRPGDGLCEVITRLGETLAQNAPAGAVNPDELDNRVRTDRDDPRK